MQFTRWYDKDKNLRFIVNVLEKLDEETRNNLASEIIQILISDKYPDTDEFIEQINSNWIASSNRWYDQDEIVHSAVEMLKYADTEEKRDLLKEFLYSIINNGDILRITEHMQ